MNTIVRDEGVDSLKPKPSSRFPSDKTHILQSVVDKIVVNLEHFAASMLASLQYWFVAYGVYESTQVCPKSLRKCIQQCMHVIHDHNLPLAYSIFGLDSPSTADPEAGQQPRRKSKRKARGAS